MYSLQLTRAHYSSSCNRLLILFEDYIDSRFHSLVRNGVPIILHSMISHVKWIHTVCFSIRCYRCVRVNEDEQRGTHENRSFAVCPIHHPHKYTLALSLALTWSTNWVAHFQPAKKTRFRHKQCLIFEWFGCHTAYQANRSALDF